MALYTAYFDESGHENGQMFTFGGLVLNVEHPAAFEAEWLAAIDPLKELHTTPFLAGGEGFKQWNSEGLGWKQEILRRAARVIAKRSFQTFSTTLDMDDFSASRVTKSSQYGRYTAINRSFRPAANFSLLFPSRKDVLYQSARDAKLKTEFGSSKRLALGC